MDRAALHRRMTALQAISGVRRDADLAALSAVSARLARTVDARDRLEADLAREAEAVLRAPDVPALRALDRHVLLAEQARALLEARIAAIGAAREAARAVAATSFGRAVVMGRLCGRMTTPRRPQG